MKTLCCFKTSWMHTQTTKQNYMDKKLEKKIQIGEKKNGVRNIYIFPQLAKLIYDMYTENS